MGRSNGRSKHGSKGGGGKSRHVQQPQEHPEALYLQKESSALFEEDREDNHSDNIKFYIDTKPERRGKKKEKLQRESAEDKSGQDEKGDRESQDSREGFDRDTGADTDLDEEFAELVQEYRSLMNPGSHNDLEWTLDEDAARILRERKAADPKYANMSNEEFDEIICFDETYGIRKGRSLQARLRRLKLKGNESSPKPHIPKEKNSHPQDDPDINFKQLNRDIKEFVRNEDVGEEFELDPYPPMIRKLVHELAHLYGLQSCSDGQGAERHCILVKCQNTRLPRDLKRLDRFLIGAQKAVRYAQGGRGKGKQGSGSTPEKAKSKLPMTTSNRVTPGTVVGSEASPIEDDNVGNKMLRKLGWSPGQGLGSEKAGRTEPVEAVYRGNRTGLGH